MPLDNESSGSSSNNDTSNSEDSVDSDSNDESYAPRPEDCDFREVEVVLTAIKIPQYVSASLLNQSGSLPRPLIEDSPAASKERRSLRSTPARYLSDKSEGRREGSSGRRRHSSAAENHDVSSDEKRLTRSSSRCALVPLEQRPSVVSDNRVNISLARYDCKVKVARLSKTEKSSNSTEDCINTEKMNSLGIDEKLRSKLVEEFKQAELESECDNELSPPLANADTVDADVGDSSSEDAAPKVAAVRETTPEAAAAANETGEPSLTRIRELSPETEEECVVMDEQNADDEIRPGPDPGIAVSESVGSVSAGTNQEGAKATDERAPNSEDDETTMASPEHVMSDHAYGMTSNEISWKAEKPVLPRHLLISPDKLGEKHPGPKVTVAHASQVIPRPRMFTPSAISADDESSDNDGPDTVSSSGGSASMWSSLNIIFNDPVNVNTNREAQKPSETFVTKKKVDKKKILRKISHSKSKLYDVETGTDTDDAEFTPRGATGAAASRSRLLLHRKKLSGVGGGGSGGGDQENKPQEANRLSDVGGGGHRSAGDEPRRLSRLSGKKRTPRRSSDVNSHHQPKISQFFEKSPRSPPPPPRQLSADTENPHQAKEEEVAVVEEKDAAAEVMEEKDAAAEAMEVDEVEIKEVRSDPANVDSSPGKTPDNNDAEEPKEEEFSQETSEKVDNVETKTSTVKESEEEKSQVIDVYKDGAHRVLRTKSSEQPTDTEDTETQDTPSKDEKEERRTRPKRNLNEDKEESLEPQGANDRPMRKSGRISEILSAAESGSVKRRKLAAVNSSDTESSILDTSQEILYASKRTASPYTFQLGDLVWVRLGSYPWWPAVVTEDPETRVFTRETAKMTKEIHVSFVGEPNRAWVSDRRAMPFQGKEELMKKKLEDMFNGFNTKYINIAYVPKPNHRERWEASIKGADKLSKMSRTERLNVFGSFNTELSSKFNAKQQQEASSSAQLADAKAMKIQKKQSAKIKSIVAKIPTKMVQETGGKLTGYTLFKLALKVAKDPKLKDEAYVRDTWNGMSKFERKCYVTAKDRFLSEMSGAESDDNTNRRSQASKRQQELLQQKEEKEKREAEKGPGWYYELVPVKESPRPNQEVQETASDLLEYKKYERCCNKCENVASTELGDVLKCRGVCGSSYHPKCVETTVTSGDEDTFKCPDCKEGKVLCSMCGSETPPPGLATDPPRRCNSGGCGRWFHPACLTATPLWPQARVGSSHLTCPAHMCHTCASDDPKNPIMKHKEKLVRCVRCPTAYHHNDHCMTAGTLIITKHDILCPKHFKPPATKKSKSFHVNAPWCFMCSEGGSLICCEICPAAFHLECIKLESPPEKYYCDNCETGRLPLYNEIVWVKIGAYRWWPAKVVPPEKVPNKIESLNHQDGEFPVQFLGSSDYAWMNLGRAFLYEEGDSEKVPGHSSKSMDASFRKGLKEAEELFEAYTKEKEAREMKNAGKRSFCGNKPAPYVKLKSNKPYGNCPAYTVDPRNLQPCDCDKQKPGPCGEDSNCINRMLKFECHPQVCNAVEKCENMRFQKRQYPDLKVIRVEGRGWGLFANQLIKKDSFVIEYVGELITMEEYRYRMKKNQETKEENYYYLTIDQNRMIDAGPKGNNARFMNHSCDPNCITQKWTVNGDTRVGLFAMKDVEPGAELTFNYQLESVGDVKKPCLCGAANCSGFIGLKPKNEKDDKKKEQEMKKKKEMKKQKKLKLKQKKEQLEREKAKKENVKVWESWCFRCHEGGSLIKCDLGLCPKSYHLSCIGKLTVPRGKWHCPWHYCSECGKPVDGPDAWCLHCPSAYCRQHKSELIKHPELSWICKEHDEEMDFLLDVVRFGGAGLAEIFPCPNPTQEQIAIWKKARGLEDSSQNQNSSSKDKSSKQKKHKNRFSLDLDTESDTETSVSRDFSRSETPSTLSTVSNLDSRPLSPTESTQSSSGLHKSSRLSRRSEPVIRSKVSADNKSVERQASSQKPADLLQEAKQKLEQMTGDKPSEKPDVEGKRGRGRPRKSLPEAKPEETTRLSQEATVLLQPPEEATRQQQPPQLEQQEQETPVNKTEVRPGRRSFRTPQEVAPTPDQAKQVSKPAEQRPSRSSSRVAGKPGRDDQAQEPEKRLETPTVNNEGLATRAGRSRDRAETPSRVQRPNRASEQKKTPISRPQRSQERSMATPRRSELPAAAPPQAGGGRERASFSPGGGRKRAPFSPGGGLTSPKAVTAGPKSDRRSGVSVSPVRSVPGAASQIPAARIESRIESTSPSQQEPAKTPELMVTDDVVDFSSQDAALMTPEIQRPTAANSSQIKFKKEEQVVWKCPQPRCKYLGTDDLLKMQNHLSFHGLEEHEVHRIAGNILAINMNLKMATRTLYKLDEVDIDTLLGAGPQKLVTAGMDSGEVYGFEDFECLVESDCKMNFQSEQDLINHCSRVHSLARQRSPEVRTKQEVILGYKCMYPGCTRINECLPGSDVLKTHWLSHPGAKFQELSFLDLNTGQMLDLEAVYPYSGECALCSEICTSTSDMAEVISRIRQHWSIKHANNTQGVSYNALSCSQLVVGHDIVSPRKSLPYRQRSSSQDSIMSEGQPVRGFAVNNLKVEPGCITDEIDYKSEQDELSEQDNTATSLGSGPLVALPPARPVEHYLESPKQMDSPRQLDSPDIPAGDLYLDCPTGHHSNQDEPDLEESHPDDLGQNLVDPMELEGPFTCQMHQCKQTLQDAQSVYRHCREQHPGQTLRHKTVLHNQTNRVVFVVALYRHVLQCSYQKCKHFVYKNSTVEEAKKLMNNHWSNKHGEQLPIFMDLSVGHPENVVPKSVDESIQSEGPFKCGVKDCDYTCPKWQMFSRHSNLLHPGQDVVSAGFIDLSTQERVSVLDFASFVYQCNICKSTSSTLRRYHAIESMEKHITKKHDLDPSPDLYRALKDEEGVRASDSGSSKSTSNRRSSSSSQQEIQFISYRQAMKMDILDNYRKIVPCYEQVKCLEPDCDNGATALKAILRHANTTHPTVEISRLKVQMETSGQVVCLVDLFKCLGQCLECSMMFGNNKNYDALTKSMRHHNQVSHGKDMTDFRVVVDNSQISTVPEQPTEYQFELVDSLEGECYFQPLYPGPYHCLAKGCTYKNAKVDMKAIGSILMDHWQLNHGSPTNMVFYAESANKVLTAKVICVNLIQCKLCQKYFNGVQTKQLTLKLYVHIFRMHNHKEHLNKEQHAKMITLGPSKHKMKDLKTEIDRIGIVFTDAPQQGQAGLLQQPEVGIPTAPAVKSGLINQLLAAIATPTRSSGGGGMEEVTATAAAVNTRTPGTAKAVTSPTTAAAGSRSAPARGSKSVLGARENKVAAETKTDDVSVDRVEYSGPFKCGECNEIIPTSQNSNRIVMKHWAHKHGHVKNMAFTDVPTSTKLNLHSFFQMVYECSVPDCKIFFGSNEKYGEAKVKDRVRRHFSTCHPDINVSDEDMLDKVSTTADSDTLDPQPQFVGPWTCTVAECDFGVEVGTKRWRMILLNHFILEHHDMFIGDMQMNDVGLGKVLMIQDIFRSVGQCNIDGCYMIRGVGGRTKCEGDYEINRSFAAHFKSDHPNLTPDFTILVDNQQVMFVREGDSQSTLSPAASNPSPVASQTSPTASKSTPAGKNKRKSMSALPDVAESAQRGTKRRRTSLATNATALIEEEGEEEDLGVCACELCKEVLTPSQMLHHATTKHSNMDPRGLRVLRTRDQKIFNLLQFLKGNVNACAEPGCRFICQSGRRGPGVEVHYRKQHPDKQPVILKLDKLGFLCTVPECFQVFASGSAIVNHLQESHQDMSTIHTPFRNLDTHEDMYVQNLFKFVVECEEKCGRIFYGNQNKTMVTRLAKEHLKGLNHQSVSVEDADTASEDRLGLPPPAVGKSLLGYQCLAGFGSDNPRCSAVIPSGNLVNALKHWQYKHKTDKLKNFIFMSTATQKLIQISDLYAFCVQCGVDDCCKTIYAKNFNGPSLDALDEKLKARMKEHFSVKHVQSRFSLSSFKKFRTSKLLSENLAVSDEEILEDVGGVSLASPTSSNTTATPSSRRTSDVSPTKQPADSEIEGFGCAIPGCNKIVLVSSVQGSSVAINRLKTHFKNKHENLQPSEFAYKTMLKRVATAKEGDRRISNDSETKNSDDSETNRYSPDSEVVYRCPNRSCSQVSVYFDSLRVHWENKHREYLNAKFTPYRLPSTEYLISCPYPDCLERQVDVETLVDHLTGCHQDDPDQARIKAGIANGETDTEEAYLKESRLSNPLSAARKSRGRGTRRQETSDYKGKEATSARSRNSTPGRCKDATPGKHQDVWVTSAQQLHRCGAQGCSYSGATRKDLAEHRRQNNHGKEDRNNVDETHKDDRTNGADDSEGKQKKKVAVSCGVEQNKMTDFGGSEQNKMDTGSTSGVQKRMADSSVPPKKRRIEMPDISDNQTEKGTKEKSRDGAGGLTCDVGGNFDYSNIEAADLSDSDEEMDINFY